MLSLHHSVFSLLLLNTLTGINCEELTPVKTEEFTSEHTSVSLSYKYHTTMTASDYFFWYRQHPGKPPEFLIYISGSNFTKPADSLKKKRFFTQLSEDKHGVKLQINSAAVTDSAVYYCAVKTQSSAKLIFGRGTRLIIEANDKYAPSYFYLENQQSSACLAAGFSPHNATLTHQLFKKDPTKAEPVQISGDSLFNQVALVSEGQGDTCDPNRNKTSVCAGTLDKDPTVNSVTLIVLALRLLFFKTVVFNVLMTLRLWMSL